jgi:hypothetical protein
MSYHIIILFSFFFAFCSFVFAFVYFCFCALFCFCFAVNGIVKLTIKLHERVDRCNMSVTTGFVCSEIKLIIFFLEAPKHVLKSPLISWANGCLLRRSFLHIVNLPCNICHVKHSNHSNRIIILGYIQVWVSIRKVFCFKLLCWLCWSLCIWYLWPCGLSELKIRVILCKNDVFVHTEIILYYFNGTFSVPSDSPTYIAVCFGTC